MSFSRCGLQYKRDFNISNDFHNHPREKQLSCWIIGDVVAPKQSTLSANVIDKELEDKLALEKKNKKMIETIKDTQEGMGVLDYIRSIPIKETIVAKVSNMFPSSDENARDIFPGEHHAIVKLPNGRYGRANYSGPGTRIVDRLNRLGGDPPRVLSDKVSQAHDIRYALAQQQKDPEKAVRDADEIYVKKMQSLQRSGLDSSINIQPAMRAIQAKMKAEDYSLLSRSKFIDTRKSYSDGDTRMLKNKLKGLQLQGYGSSLSGGYSVQSRRKTRISPSDEKNPKSQTTSQGSRTGYLKQTGGAQAPGTAQTTSSQNIDIKTRASHPVRDLLPTYFDNEYGKDKRAGSSRTLGHYGEFQGQRHVNASNYDNSRQSPINRNSRGQTGAGYPGSRIIQSDVINVIPMKGGRKRYPADKLLKKMAKKIKNKGRKFDTSDLSMSHFLAKKLSPMIYAH